MVIFIQAKKNFTEKSGGQVSFISLTQMKLPDASSDVLIICFVFAHRLRYKLFDKRMKPWELPVLFLNENRSPTARFHHNSLHTRLDVLYLGEGQTTTRGIPSPTLYE